MFNTSIGIDLGTASVVVYLKGKGIILNEPSVIAVDKNSGETVAVGSSAQVMLGRNPPEIEVSRPLRSGVISSYTLTEAMIKAFLGKAMRRTVGRPRIMMCVPSGVTDVEQRAVIETARQMGGKEIFIMEEPVAAALGAGIDVTMPRGAMVIDIGGGTTDIAAISVGKIISGRSLKIAGDDFTDAVVRYMRKKYNLIVGPQTAEHIKITIGGAKQRNENISCVARGICTVSGMPKAVMVSSHEIKPCFDDFIHNITERSKDVLEEISPQLQADILEDGIVLTGGGSLLYGLSDRLSVEIGVKTRVADFAASCVAKGAGFALDKLRDEENFRYYKKAYITNAK